MAENFVATVEQRAKVLGRKFGPDDIQANSDLIPGAFEWAKNYRGKFEWMIGVRNSALSGYSLRARDLAGVLNTLVYEAEQDRRRALYETNKAAPVQPQAQPQPQPAQVALGRAISGVKAELARSYDELFPESDVAGAGVVAIAKADEVIDLNDPAIQAAEAAMQLNVMVYGEPKVGRSTLVFQPVPSGTYTVGFDDGSYVTVRVQDASDDEIAKFRLAKGAQFIGYLNGPDNWSNYKNIGTFSGTQVRIWSKYQHLDDKVAAVHALFTADKGARNAMGVAYAKESGNCYVCGRKLTTPESLAAGIGPVCAGRV